MNIKRIITSTESYKVATVIAVALLLLLTGISYKQVNNLYESAELVSESLAVDAEINNLFSHFRSIEAAEFRAIIAKDSSFLNYHNQYREQAETSLARLYELTKNVPEHQKNLDSVSSLKDNLFNEYRLMNNKIVNYQGEETTMTDDLKTIIEINKNLLYFKTEMNLTKGEILRERLAQYSSQSTFTPSTLLVLALFSLGVFAIAFGKIDNDRIRIASSKEFLQSVLDGTDNIMNYYEPVVDSSGKIIDFTIVFANECNKDYLGLIPEEIVGKSISTVFPVISVNGDFDDLVRCIRDGETIDFERQMSIHGENMWFRSIIKPLSKGILLTARNNTNERLAEEKLRLVNEEVLSQNEAIIESKIFLEGILKTTENVIMSLKPVKDKEGIIVDFTYLYINEQIKEITKTSPESIIGKNVSEVNPSVFKSGVFEKMVKSYEQGNRVTYETTFKNDGGKMWFQGTAIRSDHRITVTSREITKEKMAMQEQHDLNGQLAIQNSILQEAKRMANIGSFTWDIANNKAVMSDNYYRILEFEPDEYQPNSENYRKLVHINDLEIYDKVVSETVNSEESSEYIFRIITKSGKIKHLKTKSKFIDHNGGKLVIGIAQDVSEFMKAEEDLRNRNLQLRRSNSELAAFNRVASHDLQEPLRKIQMFVSTILDETELSERDKLYFAKITNAADRMRALINNLLTYSRIEITQENFEILDLNQILDLVEENLYETIKDTKTKIVIKGKLPKIKGLPFNMEQLFTNLISNAIKYRKPNKTSKILVEAQKFNRDQINLEFSKEFKNYYRIMVKDNGIGFPQEHAENIFEIFKRLHSKNEYAGTGIGLAICKKIIENHNGYIHANGILGKGSTFYIYLPA